MIEPYSMSAFMRCLQVFFVTEQDAGVVALLVRVWFIPESRTTTKLCMETV